MYVRLRLILFTSFLYFSTFSVLPQEIEKKDSLNPDQIRYVIGPLKSFN